MVFLVIKVPLWGKLPYINIINTAINSVLDDVWDNVFRKMPRIAEYRRKTCAWRIYKIRLRYFPREWTGYLNLTDKCVGEQVSVFSTIFTVTCFSYLLRIMTCIIFSIPPQKNLVVICICDFFLVLFSHWDIRIRFFFKHTQTNKNRIVTN